MPYQKKATTTSATKTKTEDTKVEKDTVKETVAEVKKPKKYEPDDLIPCRSMYAGTLLFTGDKTKITYEFSNIIQYYVSKTFHILSIRTYSQPYLFVRSLYLHLISLLKMRSCLKMYIGRKLKKYMMVYMIERI